MHARRRWWLGVVAMALGGCAGAGTQGERAATSDAPSTAAASTRVTASSTTGATSSTPPVTEVRPSRAPNETTKPRPSSTVSSSLPDLAGPLTDFLPRPGRYTYRVWTPAENDAFLTGPYASNSPYVEQFAGADVVLDGRVVARIELNSLSEQFRATPDAVVLDGVAEFEYFPGPQEMERLIVADEQVLVRRTPSLVAWSWYEDGIVFNVVADNVDPAAADEFVAGATAADRSVP